MSGAEGVVAAGAVGAGGRQVRHVLAGSIGNVLEWYDFAVYGYLAAVIGRQFFPQEDATASLLAAFAVFAVGFLMRPVGGILVGHIGDRHGRRIALLVSVAGMAVPTVLIGAMPTYDSIGLAAPVALVLLRMLQGLSVGGEYVGSFVFLVEGAPPRRRGLVGAFAAVGAFGGILLGSATVTLLDFLAPPAAVEAWAWRVPFLAGVLLALAGFVLRRTLEEPLPREGTSRLPLVDAVTTHGREIVVLAALTAFNAVVFYVSFVYVPNWLQLEDGMAPDAALGINTANMMLLIAALLFFGWLSDHIGRVRILAVATFLAIFLSWPLFWVMHHDDPWLAFLGQAGFVMLAGAYGVLPTVMVEAVDRRIRVTAVAIAFNVSMGLLGGLAPLIAGALISATGAPLAPAFFVAAAGAISFVSTRFLADGAGRPLR